MAKDVDDDLLGAFLDGELEADRTAEIAAALAEDGDLARRLEALRRNDARLGAAISQAGAEGLAGFQATVERLAGEKLSAGAVDQPWGRRFAPTSWPMMLAASFAGILFGLTIGFYAATSVSERNSQMLAQAHTAEQVEIARAVDRALETLVSGRQLEWRARATGAAGWVSPVRTYQAKNGQWCREYVLRTSAKAGAVQTRAVACREGQGRWRTRLKLLPRDSAAAT